MDILNYQIQARKNAWANEKPDPENNVAQYLPPLEQFRPTHARKRYLQKLHSKQVATDLLEEAPNMNVSKFALSTAAAKRESRLTTSPTRAQER